VQSLPQELSEYLTSDGSNPFRKWLLSFKDRQTRARIRVRLNRIRLGNFGDCRSVGDGVHELRIPMGPGYRIYFGRVGQVVTILLCGGGKRSQESDIRTAKRFWRDYQERVS
jgi:putative addiction module killer protein